MKLQITIDGTCYEVEVEAFEVDRPHAAYVPPAGTVRVPALPVQAPAAAAKGEPESGIDEASVCRSPVSGTVIRLLAQEGQELQAGDALLVLEAMKMETNITAPRAGRLARVRVAQGDPVRAGQVLVELG
jgi:methylmalonyl-CoA carboxyltransferase small subunit